MNEQNEQSVEETAIQEQASFVDSAFEDSAEQSVPSMNGEDLISEPEEEAQSTAPVDADSAEQANPPASEPTPLDTLNEQVANLDKRLRDTQRALTEACERRKAAEKELEELRQRKEDDDDWFSEADERREQELENQISDVDKLAEFEKSVEADRDKVALATWDALAYPVEKEHPDFKEKVYGYLGDKLDEEKGDPMARQLWEMQKDKSPAAAYAFAVALPERLEMLNDPEGYKRRIANGGAGNVNTGINPTGSRGLAMINSESSDSSIPPDPDSFVDAIFK